MENEKQEEEKKKEEMTRKKEEFAIKEKKLNEKEKKIVDEYVRKEERKMTNWQADDAEDDSNKERRLINMKIFKSIGLRRYRKQAIPRIRKKMKYKKALKLRKIKGYKPYKGQIPQGRDEYNIPINVSHSKKLLSGTSKSF
ncbi:hypothetical protein RFI_16686 [Reticulomyxa filosa]|uniref:Uncharacterized protein n=1 Tax=Reticulomyxa filosa TaxID=46433 RepID=X6N458_RETFI|nr:hypothetical protein RFI_16686 [Reticulomyxa filosa]|eukprot:ETO20534.1 hypothetical protein RFI_16686 [Reticulomyxa filosa]